MALDRQLNIKGQMRIDVPHLRSIESSIAHDFDVLAGGLLAGRQPIVVKGFSVIPPTGTIAATSLQLSVAGSIVTHYGASEVGSLFAVPDDRAIETLTASNPRVQGGFVANQTNYVGIDIVRTEDASTSDVVEFLDANSLTETPKTIPLGRTADYRIVISSTPFSANGNVAPVAIITTNAQNQVSTSSIKDARNLMFRLGTGGDSPNKAAVYAWPGGRVEGADSDFASGDKAISSDKDWKNAVMHRIWELGGGDAWYAPSSAASLRLVKDPSNVFASTSDNFEFVSSNLHWKGLSVVFDNSTGWKNNIADQTTDSAGLTNIVAGECIYVDLNRATQGATITAQKATLASLGAAPTPGARMIIAWCSAPGAIFTRDFPMQVGASFIGAAGTGSNGSVRIGTSAPVAANPVVPVLDNASSVVAAGISRNSSGGSSIAAGVFSLAVGANDTSLVIGQSAAAATVNSLSTTFARGVTVSTGGLTVTAGGITVNGGGLAINGGAFTTTAVDYAGALSLGTANATSVAIGKAGVTTTVAGPLTVTQALTSTAALTAPSIDRGAAAALDIGTTNANAVNISKSGVLTKVFGTFESVGAATFTGGVLSDSIGPKTGGGTIAVSSNLSVTGNVNASGNMVAVGNVTAAALYGDAIHAKTASGALNIGTTSQTGAVNISQVGQTTTVKGNLAIDGTLAFNSTLTLNAASGAGLNANGKKITGLPTPSGGSSDAATAAYVDAVANGITQTSGTIDQKIASQVSSKLGFAYWNGSGCVIAHNCTIYKSTGTGNYYVAGAAVNANSVAVVNVVADDGSYDIVTMKKYSAQDANSRYYEIQTSGGAGKDTAHVVMVMTA